jgi:hypothetical protein
VGDAVAHGARAEDRDGFDGIKRHLFSPRKPNKKNILDGDWSSG